MSCGFTAPSVIWSPACTCAPSSIRSRAAAGIAYSRTSSCSYTIPILRARALRSTRPATRARIAGRVVDLASSSFPAGSVASFCALLHLVSVLHESTRASRQLILIAEGLSGCQPDLADLSLTQDRYLPVDLGDHGLPLGGTRFEKLFHARQPARDVLARDSACVERPHRQLCPGSPMLCAAMIPTASPSSTGRPVAKLRP